MINLTTKFVAKSAILWIVVLFSSVVGGMLMGFESDEFSDSGPFSGGQAFLLVNGLHAIVLAAIAAVSVVRGVKLAAIIAATLYFAQSFFLLIEAYYFRANLNVPISYLIKNNIHVLITACFAGIACALLWRHPVNQHAISKSQSKIALKIGIISCIYVLTYFVAGYYIVWAAPEIRDYYNSGDNFNLFNLLLFQIFRGILWGLLAFTMVKSIGGRSLNQAFVVGLAFSVLASAQLLYPNPFMPWDIRLPHLIEVSVSNFVFGAITVLILKYNKA